jgi:hypothetical protein
MARGAGTGAGRYHDVQIIAVARGWDAERELAW